MYIVNTYPSGEVQIIGENCGIQLLPDGRIYYGYFGESEDEEYIFVFDLFSEIGELWQEEIKEMILFYQIEIGKIETDTEYRDCWKAYTYKTEVRFPRRK